MAALKKYLIINSLFSALTGLVMLVFTSYLNTLFGITNDYVFPVIGLNLLVFSSIVYFVSIKQLNNRVLVNLISGLDALWVLGSLIIIMLGLFNISETGNIIIGIVAMWIAFLGFKQFRNN
jgi:hypothetical protein